MADPTSRVLRLLSLLQTHRYWGGAELAERLAVSERTLRRDVDRLRELGYPVDAARGVGGGYQLKAGSSVPPLLLDDEDAIAIAIGLRTAAGGGVRGIEEAAIGALAKLDQVLPARLRARVAALQESIAPVSPGEVAVDMDVLTTLAQAVRDRERVRFAYRRRDGELTTRTVEPHHVVPFHSRWYLAAWDVHRDDWRTFRLDRVEAPTPSAGRFSARPIPGGDAARFVHEAIASRPVAYEADVTIYAPIESIPHAVRAMGGQLEAIDAETTRLRRRDDELTWISAALALLDCDFRIEGPPELIAHVRLDAERRAAAVG